MIDSVISFFASALYEVVWVKVVLSFVKKTSWGKNFTAIGLWWTVFVSIILFIVILSLMLFLLEKISLSTPPIALAVTFIVWVPFVLITGKYLHRVGR